MCTKKLLKSMQARSTGGKQDKMEAMAEIYTENFDVVRGPPQPQWRAHRPCILFDSFSTCIRRFHALHQYRTKVHKELRKHIEACSSPSSSPTELQRPHSGRRQAGTAEPEFQGPLLRPVPKSGAKAASRKLNSVQHKILKGLKAPLDFVQGPPGVCILHFNSDTLSHAVTQRWPFCDMRIFPTSTSKTQHSTSVWMSVRHKVCPGRSHPDTIGTAIDYLTSIHNWQSTVHVAQPLICTGN